MNVTELERAKKNARVDIRRAELGGTLPGDLSGDLPTGANPAEHPQPPTPESIVIYLPPSGPPTALLTDPAGRSTPKVLSYLDLLYTLEESAHLDELSEDHERHTRLPPLPPNTILVDRYENTQQTNYVFTGVIEPATHLFILDYPGEEEIKTYELPMPHVCWRAAWCETTRSLSTLSIAFVSPEHTGPVTPGTELYHYPFEHVYAGTGPTLERVCWPTLQRMKVEPADIPEKAVVAFLNSPNQAGHASKVDVLLAESGIDTAEELLEEIERSGAIPHDWLTPAALNVQQLHDQKRRSS